MAKTKRPYKPLYTAGAAVSALLMSSCALPPEQAWQKIQTNGLFSYIAYETSAEGRQAYLARRDDAAKPSPIKERPLTPVGSPTSLIASNSSQAGPVATSRPVVTTNDGKVLSAIEVPSLPGFVRSPYTSPPRLVDVKGAVPGTRMICPYTQRTFVVPGATVTTPNTLLASSGPTRSVVPAPAPVYTPPPQPRLTPAPTPSVAVTPSPASTQGEPNTVNRTPAPAPVRKTPATAPTIANLPPSEPKPAPEIPYAAPIEGRPGFVNSPYAQKHQLVDVTGLPTGMEVKCPYSGKLFRVPNQDVVTSKPVDGPTVAAPEKK